MKVVILLQNRGQAIRCGISVGILWAGQPLSVNITGPNDFFRINRLFRAQRWILAVLSSQFSCRQG